jgi:hypothetical protein
MLHWTKRLVLAPLAFAMLVIAAVAPRVSAQADEALKLQKQFQDAVVAADTSTIAPLMADEAIFIHGQLFLRTI